MTVPEPAAPIELRVRLASPPEEVFRFFVDPDRYVQWQGVRAELDPRPGGIFRVWMDATTVASGAYVEVEPPTRCVFTWGWENDPSVPPGSTTVELTLEPDGDETVLLLRHTGLPDGASAALHEEGWTFFTGRLAMVAGGADPGPMPDRSPSV
jgi:uncharacterized protein YndB with AHSA1/START domain